MQATEKIAAIGVYDDLENAERTVDDLRRAGFQSEQIGIIGHVGEGEPPITVPATMRDPEENVVSSLVKGSIWGGITGLVVLLVVPGLGAVSGAGFWFEALGGLIFGAVVGGVLFAFGSLIYSPPRGRFLAGELEKGHIIVTVKTANRRDEAVSLLKQRR